MAEARAKFNDKTDPSYAFENQCTAFRAICPECGTKFPSGSRECPNCGATRPRCQNTALKGEVVCRKHLKGRTLKLSKTMRKMNLAYKVIMALLAGVSLMLATLTDTELEEIVTADDRDLSQEFALARVCISAALDNPRMYSSRDILIMLKDFFTIAEKKKNVEQGQVLNISWNDDLVNSLRSRVRKLIRTFSEIVEENITDSALKKKMLEDLYTRTKINGNMVSCPPKSSDYVQPVTSNELIQEKLNEINKDFISGDNTDLNE